MTDTPFPLTGIYGTAAERDDVVTRIRMLADFIESHPHLPLPTSVEAVAHLQTYAGNLATVYNAAVHMGAAFNSHNGMVWTRRDIGQGRTHVSYAAGGVLPDEAPAAPAAPAMVPAPMHSGLTTGELRPPISLPREGDPAGDVEPLHAGDRVILPNGHRARVNGGDVEDGVAYYAVDGHWYTRGQLVKDAESTQEIPTQRADAFGPDAAHWSDDAHDDDARNKFGGE